MELTKGQKIYYARISNKIGVFDVIDLKIRTVGDTWFVGLEQGTKQAYMLSKDMIGENVFLERRQALDIVWEAEEKYKNTNKEDSDGNDGNGTK